MSSIAAAEAALARADDDEQPDSIFYQPLLQARAGVALANGDPMGELRVAETAARV